MHLIALVESEKHVCCRYRLAVFRPFLEAVGHTLDLLPLPRGWWPRLQVFRKLAGANVILQRRLFPTWQIAILRRTVRRLIFDFDDAVFLRDSYAPSGLQNTGRLRRFIATVRACDAVLAGNSFLQAKAMAWSNRPRIYLFPTCVDPQQYPRVESEQDKRGNELVWIGSSSTLQGLERIAPLLEEVGARVPGVRLKLICDRFIKLQRLPVEPRPWSAENEGAELATADIGISWMPDDDWSRGKCGLKVLQYMAAGLPVVANSVGVHSEMIKHGETGFLANTPGEWVGAVNRLTSNPALRRRMGSAGRQLLEDRFSVSIGAKRWLTMLDGLQHAPARSA